MTQEAMNKQADAQMWAVMPLSMGVDWAERAAWKDGYMCAMHDLLTLETERLVGEAEEYKDELNKD